MSTNPAFGTEEQVSGGGATFACECASPCVRVQRGLRRRRTESRRFWSCSETLLETLLSRCVEISEFSVVVSKVSRRQRGTHRKMPLKYVDILELRLGSAPSCSSHLASLSWASARSLRLAFCASVLLARFTLPETRLSGVERFA